MAIFAFGPSVNVSQTMAQETSVRFNRDIRPILSDKCFACHGPDAETVEGGLRLDLPEEATAGGAIEPGDAEASEAIRRIFSADEDEIMPPPKSHKPLSLDEKKLLRQWVNQGGEYEPHWAYAPLSTKQPATNANSKALIDQFIDARLQQEKITPAPAADRITLIRRLSFDLTGMPPTLKEVDDFLKDQSENAYQRLVDRLLDSPRYGERMAVYWLDLVRYADTVGYHGDQNISQSPYRDYVINAFNANMPYDQFVREQLAGDLLPNPTIDQRIASGYNRLNQTTEEGGAQAKEYLSIYFADRVRNVSQVFMGATVGCAQCHDHKYDPYTARDFYSLGAFFADIEEKGVYSGRKRDPVMPVPTATQVKKLAELDARLTDLQLQVDTLGKSVIAITPDWESALKLQAQAPATEHLWLDDKIEFGGTKSGTWQFVTADQGPVKSGKRSRRQNAKGLVQHFVVDVDTKVATTKGTKFYSWVFLDPKNPPKAIMLQFNDGDWEHRMVWGSKDIPYGRKPKNWTGYFHAGALPATGEWVRLKVDAAQVGLTEKDTVVGIAFTQFDGLVHWDRVDWVNQQGLPTDLVDALSIATDKRAPEKTKLLADYFVSQSSSMIALKKSIEELKTARKTIESQIPRTVVTKAVKPRTIRILHRGDWMDDDGDIVEPAIPSFLGKLELGSRRGNRLDLANWISEPDNPLTSRTMVNRLWSLMFGRGIATSVNDLGGQGTYPSYPDMLDQLAGEFVESGGDVKDMLRTIANSEAYRRQSKPTSKLLRVDPYNDLFARQGRFRVDAESVRDIALATSGLLVEKLGGQSVRPYQPAAYYAELNFPRRKYQADMGDQQYRRGVYTHWQRTFLHPMLKAFDAPSREECTAARSQSNTPLQALTLLNDPTFLEAARVFASRIVREGGDDTHQRLSWAYRNAVSRHPSAEVEATLSDLYDQHLQHYQANRDDAKKLISHGLMPIDDTLDAAELAAWTSVARVILNLHETITRY